MLRNTRNRSECKGRGVCNGFSDCVQHVVTIIKQKIINIIKQTRKNKVFDYKSLIYET